MDLGVDYGIGVGAHNKKHVNFAAIVFEYSLVFL